MEKKLEKTMNQRKLFKKGKRESRKLGNQIKKKQGTRKKTADKKKQEKG